MVDIQILQTALLECNNDMRVFKKTYSMLVDQIYLDTHFLPPNARIKQRIWHIINTIHTHVTCKMCNNIVRWCEAKNTYSLCCSQSCSRKDPDRIAKQTATNLQRYGVDNPSKSKQIHEKVKHTNLLKFGSEYASQSRDIKNKVKQTNLTRRGHTSPFSCPSVKAKIKTTVITKYGVDHINKRHINPVVYEKLNSAAWLVQEHRINQRTLTEIAYELNVSDVTIGNYMRLHNIDTEHFFQSQPERDIVTIIQEHTPGLEILTNIQTIIPPKELDIYIPSLNIAIEYCGLFWHSDAFVSKQYHKDKLNACEAQGIRLITIFEDEWVHNRELIINKILNILNLKYTLKVFARKCIIKSVNSKEKSNFYNQYHIQGTGPGSITYGLYYNNQLVSCMTFIKKKDEVYELNRYATSCAVVGGFSKLLRYFTTQHPTFKEIISFADLRWSQGRVYEINGFELAHITPPIYEYIINWKRVHRSLYCKKVAVNKIKEYNMQLTEAQNMKNANILKIWNCGLKKYKLLNRKVDANIT